MRERKFSGDFDVVPQEAIVLHPRWTAQIAVEFANGLPSSKGEILIFDSTGKCVKRVACAVVARCLSLSWKLKNKGEVV
jgi:hypothetical protein